MCAKLSIILVNWNTRKLLNKCLNSISLDVFQVGYRETETLVVDNASTDDSVEMVGTKFPWVKLIANAENVGFARAKYRAFKRCGEFLIATISLVLISPLFLIIAVLIKIDSEGPVFFRQERVGHKGKIFEMWKFRTMRNKAEGETGPVWAEEEDPRVTRLGRFLRKSHLDELPQLINVFKGQMSLIGPRPERPVFVDMIADNIPQFYQRLYIRPGITGLAQSRYPYGASLKDAKRKLKYDLLYIERMCWLLDFRVMLWTTKRVLTGEGAR